MVIDDNFIIKMYCDHDLSVTEIAEKIGTYPNKVRRRLVQLGIPLKTKSEAQRNALLQGRTKHPTEGTKRDKETKRKISEGTAKHWEKLDEFSKKKKCKHLTDYRNSLTEEEKKEIMHLSSIGRRKAATKGSKFEIVLSDYLTSQGYSVIFHKKGAIINPTFEVDMLLPTLKVAIEVDGPTHYLPIHGEEKLLKQQRADAEKNGLLISEGWVIIRFKHIVNNLTEKYKYDSCEKILQMLKIIEGAFPPENKRLIYME